jgi:hypothetical protein
VLRNAGAGPARAGGGAFWSRSSAACVASSLAGCFLRAHCPPHPPALPPPLPRLYFGGARPGRPRAASLRPSPPTPPPAPRPCPLPPAPARRSSPAAVKVAARGGPWAGHCRERGRLPRSPHCWVWVGLRACPPPLALRSRATGPAGGARGGRVGES